ncbi:zinc resistance-associated protein [Pseudodesulfovibrio nedwellii]|uniref:Zinc resistance-associated protein n=1 Tax=Pseudodesulfovibrio nedwellii TaxID=2973072 RepID=A0ABM8B0Y8_9BACT|nr:periplasmic heavy metal sensor [Pseudodesulfovibrio nedwellii]BDQ37453.1 zinc resistance-associated protein [Pseudodesulfovibrio nedwellii]
MNKKNITITALAAVLVLSMAAMAMAGQGYGHGQRAGNGCGGNGVYSQLTPEKQVAVDKIFDKYQPKFTELRDQMWAKHATLQAMVNGGNADEQKITKLTTDMTKLRAQMRDTRDSMRAELEKETGIVAFNGRGPGQRQGRGYNGDCYGQGRGDGYNCNGQGPRFN